MPGFALSMYIKNWSHLGPFLSLYMRSPLNLLLGEADAIVTMLFFMKESCCLK